jgi:N-acetylglutamate synthase-like GNAT family acetyltransferase
MTAQLPPHVRRACAADCDTIATLLGQLGYASTPAQLQDRLAALAHSSADLVLVATQDGTVTGCIGLHILPMFHAGGGLGRITSLVVDARYRGQRIGSALMAAASAWFASNGCLNMEVTSSNRRLDAHRFYDAQGMARDSQRFSRAVV